VKIVTKNTIEQHKYSKYNKYNNRWQKRNWEV